MELSRKTSSHQFDNVSSLSASSIGDICASICLPLADMVVALLAFTTKLLAATDEELSPLIV
jgi:hypothetical protein